MMPQYSLKRAAIRVCVDNKEEGCRLCGRVYSRQMSEPLSFTDAGSLVLRIEEILDARNFPQAYQCSRAFTAKKRVPPNGANEVKKCLADEIICACIGNKATFEVCILTRQKSTWQGSIDWLDGNPPQIFFSDLEFLRLVDERLT